MNDEWEIDKAGEMRIKDTLQWSCPSRHIILWIQPHGHCVFQLQNVYQYEIIKLCEMYFFWKTISLKIKHLNVFKLNIIILNYIAYIVLPNLVILNVYRNDTLSISLKYWLFLSDAIQKKVLRLSEHIS